MTYIDCIYNFKTFPVEYVCMNRCMHLMLLSQVKNELTELYATHSHDYTNCYVDGLFTNK